MENVTELAPVKSEDFGLEIEKASEIVSGLEVTLAERKLLADEFKEVSSLEITDENIPKFKELRLRIVKNRTQGIVKWHKTNKAFYLAGGRFVDAIKNKEVALNEQMEAVLLKAENHFIDIERAERAKVQAAREAQLTKFVSMDDVKEDDLTFMSDEVWAAYLSTYETKFNEAKALAEKEERERKAKEEAERIENERIRKENAELKAKQDAIEKEAAEREAKIQANLSKGDAAKVEDLIKDLEALKTKYTFKSAKNQKKYADTGLLIDKVIGHIKS